MNKTIVIAAVVVVVAAAAGFFGGMVYQKNQASIGMAGGGMYRRFGGFGQGGAAGMRPTRGQVLSTDSNSLTIKLADGSSKIVVVDNGTTFVKATAGSVSDVTPGETVTVIGSTNSDGSITAQTVSIGSLMMRGGATPSAQPTQ